MVTARNVSWTLSALGFAVLIIALIGLRENLRGSVRHGENPNGSWLVTVMPEPAQVDLPRMSAFKALITLTEDGTLVESDIAPRGGFYELATSGHGNWTKVAPRSFTFTFVKLLTDGAGNFRGTMRADETFDLSLGGDDYVGTGQLRIFDSTDKLTASYVTKTQAKRIEVELR